MTYIILSLAVFTLGLIAVYAYFIIKNEFGISKYEKHAKKKIDEHMKRVINSSEAVLNESTEKMNRLLSQTNHFKGTIESQAKMIFEDFKDRYVASLNSELASVEKQYEEAFYQNMKDLRKKLDGRFKEQMDKTDELVEVFKKTQFENVTRGLEAYRKQQEEKSVQELQIIFTKVLDDVVKKSLTKEDQKRLIWSSLESIKKDFFSGKK
ncbi:MAG: hypothetical protein WBB49_00035 [Microgenomates group bacterium]